MVKILKFPNRNSPASKEKMEELLIANEEFNKKEDEFDNALIAQIEQVHINFQ